MTRLIGTSVDPLPEDQRPLVKVWLQGRMKYCSGFCNDGHCEGTKPKTVSGKGIKTCPMFDRCPCLCHFQIDQMFKLSGADRIPLENPLYHRETIDFNIEDYLSPIDMASGAAPFSTDDTDVHSGPQDAPTTGARPDPVALAQRRTETGRAARGGLEAQVLEAVNECFESDKDALPKEIAAAIADRYKIPTPSTGAIGAVFNRWEELGFAVQARKPVRLIDWAGEYEGTWTELELLKARKKREKKQAKVAVRLGQHR